MRRHVVAAALLGMVAGCGSEDPGPAVAAGEEPAGEQLTGTLTVFAAASLTDVFEELGGRLEEANPDLEVRFNLAGSSALATQIVEGAPADVFASADEPQMQVVVDDDRVSGNPVVFTANVLSSTQVGECRALAGKGPGKFESVAYTAGPLGAPRLRDSIAWIDCTVQAEVLVGDHFMVIGTVGAMEAADGEPLLFQAGQFGTYQPLAPVPSPSTTGA